uniref:YjjG family noncanonical pyrimidine nucleotidase n=1 Tax=Acetatifactor sp. TaxID=1872090 RepID=UPI004057B4BA
MKEFTTIFWDVDGTLLDFKYSERQALKKCCQTVGKKLTEEMLQRYSEINDLYWKQLELGNITKKELLTARFVTWFEECGIRDVDVEAFRMEYQEGLANIYAFIDDSLTICKSLHGQVKQYVITNGVTSIQKNKLKLSGLTEVMDGLFISEEIGAPKPQREFFDYCLKHVEEKDKSKILIVGDSLSSDIKGGVMAGIPTCWYRKDDTENATQYIPDYEINDLHRIYDILNVFG